MQQRCRVGERASLAQARRGRVLLAGLIVLLGLVGLGVVERAAIAQQVVRQHRWRMAMDPTVLTVKQEKAKAASRARASRNVRTAAP